MAVSYRWVIVGVGALMGCVAAGTMFSLAVFLEPMARQTEWSRAEISSAMTINFLVMGVGGFAWGAISDRFGPRIVALCGAVLLGAGLLVASRATTPLAFRLGYGILIGLSAAAFFAPMIAAVTSWFNRQRALAVSLVSAGIGVAPITVSPFAAWLIANYDWRSAMALIGIFAWVLLLPAALLVRSAPQTDDSGAPFEAAGGEADSPPVVRALGSAQFVVLALTFFLCCG